MHKDVSIQENLLAKIKLAKGKIKTSQMENIQNWELHSTFWLQTNNTKLEILPADTSTINSQLMETRNNSDVTKMCPKNTN